MCAAPASPPAASSAEPPARPKRRRLYLLGIVLMVLGIGLSTAELMGWLGEAQSSGELRRVVFPTKRKADPVKLGVEYHYDRDAVVDSRMVDRQILGLAAAGNLVVFDAESYALRADKVLHRRATCLGPVADAHVLVGIANGCVVRVSLPGLALERVADVPGVPRWIGKSAKGGGLLVAYQTDAATGTLRLKDLARDKLYDLPAWPTLFLDRSDRLWIGSGERLQVIDLERGTRRDLENKGGWPGVAGFAEPGEGQVWAFGGKLQTGAVSSFVARVAPDAKPVWLYSSTGKHDPAGPSTPITHVLDDPERERVIVVAHEGVSVSDPRTLRAWSPLDPLGGTRRGDDGPWAMGQAHLTSRGILLNRARGGFLEVTGEFTRRHVLEGEYAVARPAEIVRLDKGMAFFGDGGPSFYAGGTWRALPDPIMPSTELLGLPRAGETERVWTAMLTIPLDGETSYVIAKGGVPRHYHGHIHGLRDTFLTARWDGKGLATLGREDLPIEPTDTFITPDRRLWNVDDQGLWGFADGHWKLVMRATGHGRGGAVHANARDATGARSQATVKSAIGEPLHFAESATTPFYGLPTSASSWSLVRLDKNDEGGIPLIDELPVNLDGRRLLLHDLTAWETKKDEFLLATDHGLCLFNVRWSTCELRKPDGLGGEVSLFMRDRSKRLWMGGPGLWVLRDLKHAVAVHPSIPMLADTRVVVLAEAPDGRLIIGTQDRGAMFLNAPEQWFAQPMVLPGAPLPWEVVRPHEPSYLDGSLVIRPCRATSGATTDGVPTGLLADLQRYRDGASGRARVELETSFDGRADVVLRGPAIDRLWTEVEPLLGKPAGKAGFAVWKRQGPRGTPAIQVRICE